MYVDTKERGLILEPMNPANKPLFEFIAKYQPVMDGSKLFDDLIDVYVNQELDYKEAMNNELITEN